MPTSIIAACCPSWSHPDLPERFGALRQHEIFSRSCCPMPGAFRRMIRQGETGGPTAQASNPLNRSLLNGTGQKQRSGHVTSLWRPGSSRCPVSARVSGMPHIFSDRFRSNWLSGGFDCFFPGISGPSTRPFILTRPLPPASTMSFAKAPTATTPTSKPPFDNGAHCSRERSGKPWR